LLSQLSSDSEAENISVASLSDEAKEALGALTSLLFGGNSDIENTELPDTTASGDSPSSQGENTLKALIAQLVNTQSNEGSEQAEPSLDKGEGNTDTSATAQESLVLSLIADELDGAQSSSLADIVTQAQGMLSSASGTVSTTDKASAVSTSGASPSSEVTMKGETTLSDTEFANTQTPADLLNAISELSPQSAQKATEAFAERMVATMPSGQQQQAVKSNIIAGINEFQQQVQQGREPGIDLSTIVADAAKEASVSSEVAAAMTARVDSQASQFLNLMTQIKPTP
jgi:flagellar hook-length control protein FliK